MKRSHPTRIVTQALQRDRKRLVWLDARALTAEVADAGAAPATERGKVQEEVTRREGILRTLESTALEDGTLTIGQVCAHPQLPAPCSLVSNACAGSSLCTVREHG